MKMKKLLIILSILVMAVSVNAANLKWDASTGQVDGYTVYFTDGTDNYVHDAGNLTEVPDIDSTLNLAPAKTYTFYVTAWNLMGESDPSNTAEYI